MDAQDSVHELHVDVGVDDASAPASDVSEEILVEEEVVVGPPPLLGMACTGLPAAPSSDGGDGEPVSVLGPCLVPDELPIDPLVYVETAVTLRDPANDPETGAFVSHIIDLDVSPETGHVYVAALPGFLVFGPSDDGLRHLGVYPPKSCLAASEWQQGEVLHGEVVEYAHVEILGDGLVATTARGNPPPEFMWGPGHPGIYGLFLLDVSDPAEIVPFSELLIPDLAGMFLAEPFLYTLSYLGELFVVDITDRSAPEVVGMMGGLGSPWEIEVVGDYAYVADTKLGLVVVDLSNPVEPQIVSIVPTAGGLQDIAYDDGVIYAAAGAAGVEIFSVADPQAPTCIATVGTGPSAVGVDVDAGFLWATNHEGVVVYDVSDPSTPVPWAVEDTVGWALHVFAHGNSAYIADWEFIHRVEVSPDAEAPEADLSPEALYFWDDVSTREFTLRNRGSADLEVVGMMAPDARVTFELTRAVIPPGEYATGTVSFADDGEPLEAIVCLTMNDPDEPSRTIKVARTSPYGDSPFHKFYHEGEGESAITIGQPVPDFLLADLDGTYHQLSEQLGRPVLFFFFSTW